MIAHSRNYYTRFRIKRAHEGLWRIKAAMGLLRPGYRRYRRDLNNPKSPKFDEIDPQWVPVIKQAFCMVAAAALHPEKADLEAVARYLTEQKLPKFSNSESDVWTVDNVITLVRCEVYRGIEFFRDTVSKKTFKTGKWDPIPNPDPDKILKRDMAH